MAARTIRTEGPQILSFAMALLVAAVVPNGYLPAILSMVSMRWATTAGMTEVRPAHFYAVALAGGTSGSFALSMDARTTAPLLCLAGLAGMAGFIARGGRWPLLVLAGMLTLVAYVSSAHGGPAPMFGFFERVFGFSPHTSELLTIGIRKTIHFTFYGMLGLVAIFAQERKDAVRTVQMALTLVLAVATFDEVRQSAVANRTGSAVDVLLDLAGAAAFASIWLRSQRRPSRQAVDRVP